MKSKKYWFDFGYAETDQTNILKKHFGKKTISRIPFNVRKGGKSRRNNVYNMEEKGTTKKWGVCRLKRYVMFEYEKYPCVLNGQMIYKRQNDYQIYQKTPCCT